MRYSRAVSQPLLDLLQKFDENIMAISPDREVGTMYGFVLRHATVFGHASPLPKGVRMGPIKQCYRNATKLWMQNMVQDTRWQYAEGFVCDPDIGLPIHHAWIVAPDGSIVDRTLRKGRTALYAGVVIPDEEVRASIVRTGCYGVLDSGLGYNIALMGKMDAQCAGGAA